MVQHDVSDFSDCDDRISSPTCLLLLLLRAQARSRNSVDKICPDALRPWLPRPTLQSMQSIRRHQSREKLSRTSVITRAEQVQSDQHHGGWS